MTLAPLVGVLLGAAGGAVLVAALWLGITPLPASVLAVAAVALLTRGLHLDGLADLADGLGSGRPAEQALDIMKRSDIGPFGVVTLVLTMLVQVAALSEVAATGAGPVALVTACVAGRLALTWACRAGVPSARPGGLGAMVAGTVRRGPALAVTALMLAALAALTFLPSAGAFGSPLPALVPDGALSYESGTCSACETTGGIMAPSGLSGLSGWTAAGPCPPVPSPSWGPALAVLAGLVAAWALRRRAVRRLGGITGDVLGALVETAVATALVVCAVVVG